jgi:hypothetical protein
MGNIVHHRGGAHRETLRPYVLARGQHRVPEETPDPGPALLALSVPRDGQAAVVALGEEPRS